MPVDGVAELERGEPEHVETPRLDVPTPGVDLGVQLGPAGRERGATCIRVREDRQRCPIHSIAETSQEILCIGDARRRQGANQPLARCVGRGVTPPVAFETSRDRLRRTTGQLSRRSRHEPANHPTEPGHRATTWGDARGEGSVDAPPSTIGTSAPPTPSWRYAATH